MGPRLEQLSSTAPPRGQRRCDTQQPSRLLPPPASFPAPLIETLTRGIMRANMSGHSRTHTPDCPPPGLPTAAKTIELISITRGRTQDDQKSKVPPVKLWVYVSSSLVNRSMGEVLSSKREHFPPSWKTSLSDNFPVCNMATRGRCSHSCETAWKPQVHSALACLGLPPEQPSLLSKSSWPARDTVYSKLQSSHVSFLLGVEFSVTLGSKTATTLDRLGTHIQ